MLSSWYIQPTNLMVEKHINKCRASIKTRYPAIKDPQLRWLFDFFRVYWGRMGKLGIKWVGSKMSINLVKSSFIGFLSLLLLELPSPTFWMLICQFLIYRFPALNTANFLSLPTRFTPADRMVIWASAQDSFLKINNLRKEIALPVLSIHTCLLCFLFYCPFFHNWFKGNTKQEKYREC